MTGEDEDEEALAAREVPANAFAPGHWIIKQATAWVIYGDPEHSLPTRDSDEQHILARAELLLTADFQTGRITLLGRQQSRLDAEHPESTPCLEIPAAELIGEITLNNQKAPPSQSWLSVRDPVVHRPWRIWMGVLVAEARLRELHPKPLVAGDEAAQDIGSETDGQVAGMTRAIDEDTAGSPVTSAQFADGRDPLPQLVEWALRKYGTVNLPGRAQILADHRAQFGRIPGISEPIFRELRQKLASDVAKQGGAPAHRTAKTGWERGYLGKIPRFPGISQVALPSTTAPSRWHTQSVQRRFIGGFNTRPEAQAERCHCAA